MIQLTKEQIKEFWEGFGCKYRKRVEHEPFWKDGMVWVYPDGSLHYEIFPLDLNNLERYAFPKILKKYEIKIFSFYDNLNDKVFWFVYLIDRKTEEVEFVNIEGWEELEDALFEVFWEVIKNA